MEGGVEVKPVRLVNRPLPRRKIRLPARKEKERHLLKNPLKQHYVTTPDLAPNSASEKTAKDQASAPKPVQSLGLFSSTAIVIGSMIGSGIFIVDADIARGTNSPALYLGAWIVTAILTMIGALSYGELAAMMPKAGGQYIYLRESLGPLWGFLYGWTLFLVIQTGTIAAVCVAFGKFLGVFFPSVSTTHWLWHIAHVPAIPIGPMVLGNMEIGVSTANLTGILIVVFLAVVNIFGVRLGALIQNVFTTAKALSIAALILLAFTIGRNAAAIEANFGSGFSAFWKNAGWGSMHPVQVGIGGPMVLVNVVVILAVVQVGSLFSADSWNNITFTAGEVRDPRRNIPLSLVLGTGFVLTVYFLVSLSYLLVLPMHGDANGATLAARGIQHAAEDRVATAALEQILPYGGAWLMAGAILVSTFGCANGLTLTGARVFYAMSKDGLFFKSVGKLHPRYNTPVAGLMIQAAWAVVLCISGSYSQLLDYIIFAELVFYILTIAGLFVLRFKRPDAPRPYKAWGYPVLPALYLVLAAWICVVLLRYKPQYTWPGLVLVLLGIPVYLFWSRQSTSQAQSEPS
jgi:APA family basic amino acid/polyamine antiporter